MLEKVVATAAKQRVNVLQRDFVRAINAKDLGAAEYNHQAMLKEVAEIQRINPEHNNFDANAIEIYCQKVADEAKLAIDALKKALGIDVEEETENN